VPVLSAWERLLGRYGERGTGAGAHRGLDYRSGQGAKSLKLKSSLNFGHPNAAANWRPRHRNIPGGPTKVKPTYIFVSKI